MPLDRNSFTSSCERGRESLNDLKLGTFIGRFPLSSERVNVPTFVFSRHVQHFSETVILNTSRVEMSIPDDIIVLFRFTASSATELSHFFLQQLNCPVSVYN